MSFFKNVFRKPAAQPSEKPPAASPPPAPAAASSSASLTPSARGTPVLLQKLVTEKATGLQARGQYTFAVVSTASKGAIAQSFRQRYGVTPQAVHVANVRRRRVRFGRIVGQTKAWKKAVIVLPPGAKIDTEKATS